MINNIREYGVFTPYSLIFKNHINLKKYYSMGLFRKTGQTFISWVGVGKWEIGYFSMILVDLEYEQSGSSVVGS